MNIVKDVIQIDTDEKLITILSEPSYYDLMLIYSLCQNAFDDEDMMEYEIPIKYTTTQGINEAVVYTFYVVNGWTFRRGRDLIKDNEMLGNATVRDLRSAK